MADRKQEDEQWLEQLLHQTDKDEPLTDKQSRVLKAAIDIFAEKGYAAASTSEIAQRAGVAEGTVFRHYKTKKDLLLSIAAPMMSKLVAPFLLKDFLKVVDSSYPDAEQFFRAIARNRMEFVRAHAKTVRIVLQEIPFHPELSKELKAVIADHVYQKLSAAVSRLQKEGQIRRDLPSPTVIRLAVSTIAGFVLTRFIFAPELQWEEEAEMEHTIQFLIRGLKPD